LLPRLQKRRNRTLPSFGPSASACAAQGPAASLRFLARSTKIIFFLFFAPRPIFPPDRVTSPQTNEGVTGRSLPLACEARDDQLIRFLLRRSFRLLNRLVCHQESFRLTAGHALQFPHFFFGRHTAPSRRKPRPPGEQFGTPFPLCRQKKNCGRREKLKSRLLARPARPPPPPPGQGNSTKRCNVWASPNNGPRYPRRAIQGVFRFRGFLGSRFQV